MDIKILYGTETGNSEGLANEAKKYFESSSIASEVIDIGKVSVQDLKDYEYVIIITSTWGDGEPPANAENLYNELGASSEDLSKLKYAVFAIGESFYDKFCQTGIDFDEYLAKAGAKRLLPIEKSDGDFSDKFPEWLGEFKKQLQ